MLLLPSPTSIKRSLCLTSIRYFASQAWQYVEPSTPFLWNWHLDAIANRLEQHLFERLKYRGIGDNQPDNKSAGQSNTSGNLYIPPQEIYNMPPGCMKSFLVSVMLNAWAWTHDPSLRFLTFAYSEANTKRDNLRVRDIIMSDWYQDWFDNVEVRDDEYAKLNFKTTAQGWRMASSVGGKGTGDHPDYIINDDLVKAQDYRSEAKLNEANEFLDNTLPSRVARDPIVYLIMQRLSKKDPTQHLLDKGGWTHIYFPMRYMQREVQIDEQTGSEKVTYEPCALDQRTEQGELLWPSLWHEEKVAKEELNLGQMARSAQLGQRPISLEGALIQRAWLPIIDPILLPKHRRSCRGWDTADTPGGGHYTVGAKCSVDEKGILYLEHFIIGQWGTPTVNSLILNTAIADGRDCLIAEGSGSGKATTDARAIDLAGYDYKVIPEQKSKVSRTDDGPFRTQAEAGNVRVVRGLWLEEVLDQICSFPIGDYDDVVDAVVNAINRLLTEKPIRRKARGLVNR